MSKKADKANVDRWGDLYTIILKIKSELSVRLSDHWGTDKLQDKIKEEVVDLLLKYGFSFNRRYEEIYNHLIASANSTNGILIEKARKNLYLRDLGIQLEQDSNVPIGGWNDYSPRVRIEMEKTERLKNQEMLQLSLPKIIPSH